MDKKLFLGILTKAVFSYPRYMRKRLFVMRPCSVSVSKKARITVNGFCFFNSEFDNKRIRNNKKAGRLYLSKNSFFNVDSATFYSGTSLSVNENASFSMGKSYCNYDCRISCFNSISIGDGCAISQNVTIRDSDNHEVIREGYEKSAPIVIEDHVWIGINSTILKGVHIGEGSIIAAGSVVTKNCPPNSLVAGVPARVIKENVHWE